MRRVVKYLLMSFLSIILLIAIAITFFYFEKPHTKPFLDEEGLEVPASIAVIETHKIGGHDQWFLIRGRSIANPPLLILHGGPGSPEAELFRYYNSALEGHFTVINYHQRGAGWSFTGKETEADLQIENYVSDIDEIVTKMSNRFGGQKIYLLGHSWGSLIGIYYIREHPEQIAAYIGIGQVSDMVESELAGCAFIREEAHKADDQKTITKIDELCVPPLDSDYVTKQRQLLSRYDGDMQGGMTTTDLGLAIFKADEGTLKTILNLLASSNHALQYLWDDIMAINLLEEPKDFQVPIYFALGRYDYQVSQNLAADYFELLSAPCKHLEWFEKSGHNPPFEKPEAFNHFMIETVKPLEGCEAAPS